MNRFVKKIISVALILVMTMGIVCVSPFAATPSFIVKPAEKSYLQGDQVSVRIYLPATLNTVASLDLVLEYNIAQLEIVSVTDGAELKAAIDAQTNGKVYSKNYKTPGYVYWSMAATTNFNLKGTFATLVFNVKNTAPNGTCALNLKVKNAANSGYVNITDSVTVQSGSFEIIKVAANDLVFDLTSDKKAYEVVAYHCATLDSLTIPASHAGLPVVGIADNALANHAELKEVVIPDSITYIGTGAFSGCSGLKELVIPDSVNTIGASAFSGCQKLEKITLPIGLKTIDKKTFYNCYFLKNIEIPFTVTSIKSGAFENCVLLETVKISRNTKSIDTFAFSNAKSDIIFKSTEGCGYLNEFITANLKDAKVELIKDFSLGTATVTETPKYTGEALTPKVAVMLDDGSKVMEGRDYKVVYKNNKSIGTATVYVAGNGDNGEGYIASFEIKCQHDFSKKELVKAATCTKTGTYKYTCSICGETKTETIPASGHTESDWIYDVRPTIEKTGKKHSECVDCHTVIKKDVVVPKVFPDLNGDKKINSSDALIVLQYSTGSANYLTTQDLLINADTNGDASINSNDALTILLISVGQLKIDGYKV